MAQTPIGELTESSMKNLKTLVDSNTVIGQPIVMGETTILPVSKVAFGFGVGGGDLPAAQAAKFGGGSGGGVTITPMGFLVVNGNDVKLLQLQSFNNTADRVVGMVPEVVDKVTGFINGLGDKKNSPPAESEPTQTEA